jgi:hypothetical protein
VQRSGEQKLSGLSNRLWVQQVAASYGVPMLGHNRGPTFSLTRRACQALAKVLAKIKERDTAPVGRITHRAGIGEEGLSRLPADLTDRALLLLNSSRADVWCWCTDARVDKNMWRRCRRKSTFCAT